MIRQAPAPLWRRWLMWPALILFVANVGAFLGYTLPRRLQERTLAERARALRDEVERERRVNDGLRLQVQAVGANMQDMRRFLKQIVAGREGLSVVLEELEQTAREQGLQPERRSYHREELDRLPLVRFQVTFPVKGSYSQLMSFLDALERSPRFVTVDKLSYQVKEESAPDMSIILSAYFAKGVENGG